LRRHRSHVAVAGVLAAVGLALALALLGADDRSAVLVAILGVLAPVAMWALDRRERRAGKASPESSRDVPPPTLPASPAVSDLPRLIVDPGGSIGGGDRTAAMAYVKRLRELPAAQRRVRTALTSASPQVVEDPVLDRARTDFEHAATEFAQGRIVYPWGPPSTEDWALALDTLWALARDRSWPLSSVWYAWPPGGAGDAVTFTVPSDDELVRRVSGRFADRPLHVQSLDPRIVWRWLAPAALQSVAGHHDGGGPVVLDDWRVSACKPQDLASVEPDGQALYVESSVNRAWNW
jgi:hypothetical protein